MLKKIFTATIIAALLLMLLGFSGCATSEADQEFIDFAEVAAEEYLISVNNRDFETFSKYLSVEMEDALPLDSFLEFADFLEGKVGKYVEGSKEYAKIVKQSGYIVVIYNTEYTEEPDGVIFSLTLQKLDGIMEIAGSHFNSPKLMEE